jgi:hypothetical protein
MCQLQGWPSATSCGLVRLQGAPPGYGVPYIDTYDDDGSVGCG